MPLIIFVTAFDQYAIDAFNIHAVDYVLKPIEQERLLEAVSRAVARHAQQIMGSKEPLVAMVSRPPGRRPRAGKSGRGGTVGAADLTG